MEACLFFFRNWSATDFSSLGLRIRLPHLCAMNHTFAPSELSLENPLKRRALINSPCYASCQWKIGGWTLRWPSAECSKLCCLPRPVSVLQLARGPLFDYQQSSELSRRLLPRMSISTRIVGGSAKNRWVCVHSFSFSPQVSQTSAL